jgi:hypothetical protein
MRKIYGSRFFTLFLLLFLSTTAFAQIPNPGFENWTSGSCDLGLYSYNNPNGWGSINVLTCPGGGFTCVEANAANAHSGSHALELTTISIFSQIAPGIIATGVINQSTQNVDGGFALTTRPDKLIGWYKYLPVNPDTFSVFVDIFSGATTGLVTGTGSISSPATVSTYTKFVVNIPYTSGLPSDSAKITILSSPGQDGQPGTKLYIDDLSFVSCAGFAATATTVNASCNSATGSITLATPVNGTAPYTYNWSNNSTDSLITNLSPGTYKVTVTDNNTCTALDSVVVSAVNTPFLLTGTNGVTSCTSNTGTVSVAASGGNSPYTYLWSNGATTAQLINLGPQTYSVTVTDSLGCTTAATDTVSTPNGPTASDTVTNILCFGATTGAIQVNVNGGTAPITYTWSPAVTTDSAATSLAAGNYTVTITDHNNCSFLVSATITQPSSALSATASGTNPLCNGLSTGSASVSATGGTAPYKYTWTGGSDTTILQNLTAGTYIVTVTDTNQCSATASYTVTQPVQLAATVSVTSASSISGSNGTASVSATGGTGAYVYNWSTTSSQDTITHLSPATYCVTVTDANFCSASACDSVGYLVNGINAISTAVIRIYPNPASNQLTIETNQADGKFMLTIYSLDGKMVEQQTIAGEKSTVLLNHLTDGLYTYQLRDVTSGNLNYGKLEILR